MRAGGEARRRRIRRFVITVALLVVAVFSILPLYLVIVTSFKTQTEYATNPFALPRALPVANFGQAWETAQIGTFMRNSAIVSIGAVALCLVASVALAYAIVFLEWRGRRLAYTLCLVLLAVPPLLLLIPVFHILVDLRLVNNLLGVILLYAALSTPFAVYLLVAYMRSVPQMVIEAAVLDGATVPDLLIRVVVPLCLPAIATAAALTFIFCWNEFIYAFVVLQTDAVRTLPAGLAALQGRFFTNFPVLLAGVTLSLLPVIAVFVFFQRYLVRGIAVGVD
jgi:ABC-type glycerol-3-phosphate transport system permease component